MCGYAGVPCTKCGVSAPVVIVDLCRAMIDARNQAGGQGRVFVCPVQEWRQGRRALTTCNACITHRLNKLLPYWEHLWDKVVVRATPDAAVLEHVLRVKEEGARKLELRIQIARREAGVRGAIYPECYKGPLNFIHEQINQVNQEITAARALMMLSRS